MKRKATWDQRAKRGNVTIDLWGADLPCSCRRPPDPGRCRSEPSSFGPTARWRPRPPPWTSSPPPSALRHWLHCVGLARRTAGEQIGTTSLASVAHKVHNTAGRGKKKACAQFGNLGDVRVPACGRLSWSPPPWRSCPPRELCSNLSACSSLTPAGRFWGAAYVLRHQKKNKRRWKKATKN